MLDRAIALHGMALSANFFYPDRDLAVPPMKDRAGACGWETSTTNQK
jgi:hypothetical protein